VNRNQKKRRIGSRERVGSIVIVIVNRKKKIVRGEGEGRVAGRREGIVIQKRVKVMTLTLMIGGERGSVLRNGAVKELF
jgi:hypothetical protein